MELLPFKRTFAPYDSAHIHVELELANEKVDWVATFNGHPFDGLALYLLGLGADGKGEFKDIEQIIPAKGLPLDDRGEVGLSTKVSAAYGRMVEGKTKSQRLKICKHKTFVYFDDVNAAQNAYRKYMGDISCILAMLLSIMGVLRSCRSDGNPRVVIWLERRN